jgi:hypothetical protein
MIRNTLLTIFALSSASAAFGQITLAELTSIDPTTLVAVHYTYNQSFGPHATCTFPDTAGLCLATAPFSQVPAKQRFVITNISVNASYNANGSSDVMGPAVGILLNVGGTIANYTFPFESSTVVGATTYYYMNRAVHIYADPSIGFGWQISNLAGVGPIFTQGSGGFSLTVTGYLVPDSTVN